MANSIVELQAYNFNSIPIYTITIDNEVWFRGSEVAAILGYKNPAEAIADHVEAWGKRDICPKNLFKNQINIAKCYGFSDVVFNRSSVFINEGGLYSLIFNSTLPLAKDFKKWVCTEVLPSINRTGAYIAPQMQAQTPQPDNDNHPAPRARVTLNQYLKACKEILGLAGVSGNQLALALDKNCKAFAGSSPLLESDTRLIAPQQTQLYTPTQICKVLDEQGLNPHTVNTLLEAAGLQSYEDKRWILTAKGKELGAVYLDVNKRHSSGTPVRQIKWPERAIQVIKDLINNVNLTEKQEKANA